MLFVLAYRRSGATIVAWCLYTAFHFGPTRLDGVDCPTLRAAGTLIFRPPSDCGLGRLLDFASLTNLNRHAANWLRLVLVSKLALDWKSSQESWRFSHVRFKHFPWTFCKGFPAGRV